MKTYQNFIGGKWLDSLSGQTIDVVNPANREVIATVPRSNQQDLEMAVRAAEHAFFSWKTTTFEHRSQILKKISELILKNLDVLALTETQNSGKPLRVSKTIDIPRSALNFAFFSDEIFKLQDERFTDSKSLQGTGGDNTVVRSPLGVVGCISPWNLPLYLFTWKIAPALAAGNCVVAKPSEVTPLTAAKFGEIVKQAGLPDGVLNIIHGYGSEVGKDLVTHSRVKAISFTGSTVTGKIISELAASQFKKVSLEMGGKNATLVFESSEKILDTVLRAAFSNQGQICLCGSRILVAKNIYNQFRDALIQKIAQLNVGDPINLDTDQGSLVSEAHFNKIAAAVELAKKEGGNILTGGKPAQVQGQNGFFYEPTLIEGLPMSCKTNQDEIFGPVATIMPFDSEDEAIQLANQSQYGLSVSIFSNDLVQANRLAQRIDVGIVWINTWMQRDLRTPFGGIKNSGIGREGGMYALHFFTEPKTICVGGLNE